jgi:hypothetical protein
MTSKRDREANPSTWAGADKDAPAHLVPVAPPKRLEVNGAPIVEQSHEFVIRNPRPNASN